MIVIDIFQYTLLYNYLVCFLNELILTTAICIKWYEIISKLIFNLLLIQN